MKVQEISQFQTIFTDLSTLIELNSSLTVGASGLQVTFSTGVPGNKGVKVEPTYEQYITLN